MATPETAAPETPLEDPLAELSRLEQAEHQARNAGEAASASEPQQPAQPEAAAAEPTTAQTTEQLLAGEFQSPEDLADAYQALRQRVGQQGNDLGAARAEAEAYRQQLAALQAGQPAAPPQAQPLAPQAAQVQFDPTNSQHIAQWEDWYAQSPAEALLWVQEQNMMRVLSPVVDALEQRLQAIAQPVQRMTAQTAVQQIVEKHGSEVFQRNRDAIAQAIRGNEDYYTVSDPQEQFRRLDLVVKAAEYDRQSGTNGQAPSPAADVPRQANGRYAPRQQGDVHMEGGSTPSPVQGGGEAQDPIVDGIDAAAIREARQGDVFGGVHHYVNVPELL